MPHLPRPRRGRRPRLRGIFRAPASRDQPFHREERARPVGRAARACHLRLVRVPNRALRVRLVGAREVHWIVSVIGLGQNAAGFNISAPTYPNVSIKYPTLINHSLQ